MRTGWCLVCVATAAFGVGGTASAQSAFEGPLATPDTSLALTKHVKAKPKKLRHATTKPATGAAVNAAPTEAAGRSADDTPAAVASPRTGTSDNPLSLGMKWQGNSDTAAETRSQNLDGKAFGSGAEVGMKLHF